MNTNMYFRRFLNAGQTGGGGQPSPSLKSLDGDVPPILPPGGDEPPKGDGTPPPDLSKDPLAGEALNEDGTLKEGYELSAENTIVKKAEGADDGQGAGEEEDDDDDDEVTPEKFWESVDKLRGTSLAVQYPDDPDFDLLSPEAVVIREKAVADEALQTFVGHLQQTDPRGYAYLLHRQGGGSDEEFFSKKTFSLPDYGTFKEDVDLQEKFYLSALVAKGLKPEQAKLIVDQAIKDNKLFELADEDYKIADKEHQKTLQEIQTKQQEAEALYQRSVEGYNKTLTDSVEKGLRIIVPDTEKIDFINFIRTSTEYNNATGKFLIVQEVSPENISAQLEAMYLLYKKGDLSKLIERKAKVLTSARLGSKMKQDAAGANHKSNNTQQVASTKSVPLGEI